MRKNCPVWRNKLLPDYANRPIISSAVRPCAASHRATRALTRASITMTKVDLWHARLALKTLRKDQREAIAEAAEP